MRIFIMQCLFLQARKPEVAEQSLSLRAIGMAKLGGIRVLTFQRTLLEVIITRDAVTRHWQIGKLIRPHAGLTTCYLYIIAVINTLQLRACHAGNHCDETSKNEDCS